MEVIVTIFTLAFIGCLIGLVVTFFKMGAIDQDRYNLYGNVLANGLEEEIGQFICVNSCRHNKSHFAPCGSCGFWHPYKYVRHLYLKRQFNSEWNKDREQIIQDKSNERQRVQSS